MSRICFITFDITVMGGSEKVCASLANALSDKHEVTIISVCKSDNEIPYNLNSSIKVFFLNVAKKRLREMSSDASKPLKKYLKENNIEIAYLVGLYASFISLDVKPFVKAKFVYCDHGAIMSDWHKKDNTLMRYLCSLFTSRTVVLTERSRLDYIKKFHIRKKRVLCIYNWIDENITDSACEYNEKSKLLLSVGRFSEEKGYDMLVEVADIVLNKHPDWQWHLYGDGPTLKQTKENAKARGITDKLIFKGNNNNVFLLYKDYAIIVLPSYQEGLPLVLLETKANKIPAVSFDVITGPREIIEDGINGFLIPMYDKKMMAKKICELIEDDKLRIDFSKHAYDNINKFSKKEILNKWQNLTKELTCNNIK